MKCGVELTFFPRKATFVNGVEYHEYLVKSEADKMAKRFNIELMKCDKVFRKYGMGMWAKSDWFRNKHDQVHKSWIIEINNITGGQLYLDWLDNVDDKSLDKQYNRRNLSYQRKYLGAISLVFKIARKFGLVARLEKKVKGKIVSFTNGGGHLHFSADLFDSGADYFDKMKMFEKCLCIQYYNNPWLRWLFSESFDNENSNVAHNLSLVGTFPLDAAAAHNHALTCNSIAQRFSRYGKQNFSTYEFRFFNAVKSVDELLLDARFLSHWIGSIVKLVEEAHDNYYISKKAKAIKLLEKLSTPTLTKRHYKKLANLDYARGQMTKFFEKIGLDFKNYEAKFQENYIRRMKWGKML